MSAIHPFKAIRPIPTHAAHISCPPYDVISTDEARSLAEGEPESFLRVIRPEIDFDPSQDPHADQVYDQGRANLERLIESGVLLEEDEPAMFIYRLVRDGHKQMGLVCTVDAAEYRDGRIRKHEKTRPDKEDDRTRHLLTSNIHAEGVFLAFRDDQPVGEEIVTAMHLVASDRPMIHFVIDDVTHTLWKVPNHSDLVDLFTRVPELYIADGHHRSAAGERVASARAESNDAHSGDEEYNRILAAIFPASQLAILPYNRIVKDLNGMDAASLLERLAGVGEIEQLSEGQDPTPNARGSFCLYLDGGWHRLTLPGDTIDHADPIDGLDVALLQDRVLAPLLGIGDPRTDPRIDFVGGIRGTEELERRVDAGDAAIAFSLHPTSMEELFQVADADEIMPPKSTWFEPKLRSGLFAHRFEPSEETVR